MVHVHNSCFVWNGVDLLLKLPQYGTCSQLLLCLEWCGSVTQVTSVWYMFTTLALFGMVWICYSSYLSMVHVHNSCFVWNGVDLLLKLPQYVTCSQLLRCVEWCGSVTQVTSVCNMFTALALC